jgi:hypothetical protein
MNLGGLSGVASMNNSERGYGSVPVPGRLSGD